MNEKLIKDFINAVKSEKKKPTPYDTSAKVVRVEGDTAWVHIAGGVDQTPVKMTTSAKQGDNVQVRVSGGRAFIVGNATAPPTDDTTAIKATKKADKAQETASNAIDYAETAKVASEQAEAYATQAKETTDEINAYADTAGKTVTQILNDGETAGAIAQQAQNSLKSVVQGATTVEKAVSVMQTALEAVAEYDPNAITETFTGDGTETDFTLQTKATNILSVTVDGESAEYTTAVENGVTIVTISPAPDNESSVSVSYDTTKEWFWHDANGAHVLGDDNGYRNDIISTGMKIMDVTSEESVAEFGTSGAQIGKTNEGDYWAEVHTDGLSVKYKDGDGIWRVVEFGRGEGVTFSYSPHFIMGNLDVDQVEDVYDQTKIYNTGDECIYDNRLYVCVQDNTQGITPSDSAYNDNWDFAVGPYSFLHGTGVGLDGKNYSPISSGYASHCEGGGTMAIGDGAHSEGYGTLAKGTGSHAEGRKSRSLGTWSHAQNMNTVAAKESQTAIGTFNIEDTSPTTTHPSGRTPYGEYAFIVGNGTTDNARSNALTVDWQGNVDCAGGITVEGHSSHIGSYEAHAPNAVSCANNYYRQLAYITLDEGVWILSGVATFPYNNTTGVRRIFVSTATSAYDNVTTAPPAWGNIFYNQVPVTGSYQVFLHIGGSVVNVSSTTTYRLIGWQNSGGTVSVTGRLYAVRIA